MEDRANQIIRSGLETAAAVWEDTISRHTSLDKDYFRIGEAATLLGITPDHLLHLAATMRLSVCIKPSLLCEMGEFETVGDYEENFLSGTPGNEVSCFISESGDMELVGLWCLSFTELEYLELEGTHEGYVYLSMPAPCWPSGFDFQTEYHGPGPRVYGKLKRPITINDLLILPEEIERLKSGKTPSTSPNKGQPGDGKQARLGAILPHPNKERFATNREQVLKAAICCKAKWPDSCKTYAAWRETIEEKALLFWPKDGQPPLKTEQIERLLGEACRLPGESGRTP